MEIIRKTELIYQGRNIEIVKYAKINPFGKDYIEGYSWRVFDVEFYIGKAGKKAWKTESEAFEDAKKTVNHWISEDDKRERETKEYKNMLKKTFGNKEDAIKYGIEHPMKYDCQECGATFYAAWRSNYSENPDCPICGVNDMYKIEKS